MRNVVLSAVVELDVHGAALEPALHFLDPDVADDTALRLAEGGARVQVEPVEAIVFDDGGGDALPRLGGDRVKLFASVDEALAARAAVSAEQTYHVVAINERSGFKSYLTVTPVTQSEGLTILSKLTPHRDVRTQLEDSYVKEDAARRIIEGTVSFDPAAVEEKFGSPHVFPFVGTIDVDAIYRVGK